MSGWSLIEEAMPQQVQLLLVLQLFCFCGSLMSSRRRYGLLLFERRHCNLKLWNIAT
jgi:hypothetical protein